MEAEIRALLQEHGVSFKPNSKSFIMSCPRCGKSQKLYIRKADGRFVCWYCKEIDGFQGRAEFALAELCSLPVAEIQKRLYGEGVGQPTAIYLTIDVADFEDEDSDDYVDLEETLKPMAWPLDFYSLDSELGIKGARYLESRGIPLSVAMEYGIRYYPAKTSVVFPVISQSNLYGWQQRLVENDKPYWDERRKRVITPLKAVTSTDLKKDRILMFADRLNGSEHCVLAEGPIDALKAHLCGGNVATMGKAVSKAQLQLIRNSGVRKLYVGLDPDAYLELDRIRKEMRDLVLYDFRPPAPYKDLGEMPMEAVKVLFDNTPVLNPAFVLIYLKNHFGAS